jgi:hypothetical protein
MPPPDAQTLYRTLTAEPARPDNPQLWAGHLLTSVVAIGLLINNTANGPDGRGAGEKSDAGGTISPGTDRMKVSWLNLY